LAYSANFLDSGGLTLADQGLLNEKSADWCRRSVVISYSVRVPKRLQKVKTKIDERHFYLSRGAENGEQGQVELLSRTFPTSLSACLRDFRTAVNQ